MDLCADQLLAHLPAVAAGLVPVDFATPFRRRIQRIPILGRRPSAFNADRLFNRHLTLPRALVRAAGFELYHVVDHSYAHVVRALPPGRAGVYCHDVDAFRSLLDPAKDPRPPWFRRLAGRTLAGLRAAAVVFHNSGEVGRQLAGTGLVPPDRLVHAPLGVAAEFSPAPGIPVEPVVPALAGQPYLLHVGSNISRKRLDVLLDVFAALRSRFTRLRLVQVGGPWPADLAARIERLGIGGAVTQVRGLSRAQLARLYREAAVVLVPSEAEGFALPVIEALACGAVVVTSDLPVLREVASSAAVYCGTADIAAWVKAVGRILADSGNAPPRSVRLKQAAGYSWQAHARIIGATYLKLLGVPCDSSS
ncbi:MAG TPA: glycosyltransferase [Gemmataceae bacterium]|nr:glycosyltransferase [Gemmataceae bacterium]